MNTIEKSRYSTGDKLELLPQNSRPPPRGWAVVNAWRFANIATRFTHGGDYSDLEEEFEARKELNMVHPSSKYGATVNLRAKPDSSQVEQIRQNQIRIANMARDVASYAESVMTTGKIIKDNLKNN